MSESSPDVINLFYFGSKSRIPIRDVKRNATFPYEVNFQLLYEIHSKEDFILEKRKIKRCECEECINGLCKNCGNVTNITIPKNVTKPRDLDMIAVSQSSSMALSESNEIYCWSGGEPYVEPRPLSGEIGTNVKARHLISCPDSNIIAIVRSRISSSLVSLTDSTISTSSQLFDSQLDPDFDTTKIFMVPNQVPKPITHSKLDKWMESSDFNVDDSDSILTLQTLKLDAKRVLGENVTNVTDILNNSSRNEIKIGFDEDSIKPRRDMGSSSLSPSLITPGHEPSTHESSLNLTSQRMIRVEIPASYDHKTNSIIPGCIPLRENVDVVALGSRHVLVMSPQGKIFGLGSNDCGQLGLSPSVGFIPHFKELSKLRATLGDEIRGIACGAEHSIVTTRSSGVWSFGRSLQGRLGCSRWPNFPSCVYDPVKVELPGIGNTSTTTSVFAGANSSFAVGETGVLFAWGDNRAGQLGIESSRQWVDTPVPVTFPACVTICSVAHGKRPANYAHVTSVSTCSTHTVVVLSDGRIFAMGDNNEGALGLGMDRIGIFPRPTAVLLPKGSLVKSAVVASHVTMVCAVKPPSLGTVFPTPRSFNIETLLQHFNSPKLSTSNDDDMDMSKTISEPQQTLSYSVLNRAKVDTHSPLELTFFDDSGHFKENLQLKDENSTANKPLKSIHERLPLGKLNYSSALEKMRLEPYSDCIAPDDAPDNFFDNENDLRNRQSEFSHRIQDVTRISTEENDKMLRERNLASVRENYLENADHFTQPKTPNLDKLSSSELLHWRILMQTQLLKRPIVTFISAPAGSIERYPSAVEARPIFLSLSNGGAWPVATNFNTQYSLKSKKIITHTTSSNQHLGLNNSLSSSQQGWSLFTPQLKSCSEAAITLDGIDLSALTNPPLRAPILDEIMADATGLTDTEEEDSKHELSSITVKRNQPVSIVTTAAEAIDNDDIKPYTTPELSINNISFKEEINRDFSPNDSPGSRIKVSERFTFKMQPENVQDKIHSNVSSPAQSPSISPVQSQNKLNSACNWVEVLSQMDVKEDQTMRIIVIKKEAVSEDEDFNHSSSFSYIRKRHFVESDHPSKRPKFSLFPGSSVIDLPQPFNLKNDAKPKKKISRSKKFRNSQSEFHFSIFDDCSDHIFKYELPSCPKLTFNPSPPLAKDCVTIPRPAPTHSRSLDIRKPSSPKPCKEKRFNRKIKHPSSSNSFISPGLIRSNVTSIQQSHARQFVANIEAQRLNSYSTDRICFDKYVNPRISQLIANIASTKQDNKDDFGQELESDILKSSKMELSLSPNKEAESISYSDEFIKSPLESPKSFMSENNSLSEKKHLLILSTDKHSSRQKDMIQTPKRKSILSVAQVEKPAEDVNFLYNSTPVKSKSSSPLSSAIRPSLKIKSRQSLSLKIPSVPPVSPTLPNPIRSSAFNSTFQGIFGDPNVFNENLMHNSQCFTSTNPFAIHISLQPPLSPQVANIPAKDIHPSDTTYSVAQMEHQAQLIIDRHGIPIEDLSGRLNSNVRICGASIWSQSEIESNRKLALELELEQSARKYRLSDIEKITLASYEKDPQLLNYIMSQNIDESRQHKSSSWKKRNYYKTVDFFKPDVSISKMNVISLLNQQCMKQELLNLEAVAQARTDSIKNLISSPISGTNVRDNVYKSARIVSSLLNKRFVKKTLKKPYLVQDHMIFSRFYSNHSAFPQLAFDICNPMATINPRVANSTYISNPKGKSRSFSATLRVAPRNKWADLSMLVIRSRNKNVKSSMEESSSCKKSGSHPYVSDELLPMDSKRVCEGNLHLGSYISARLASKNKLTKRMQANKGNLTKISSAHDQIINPTISSELLNVFEPIKSTRNFDKTHSESVQLFSAQLNDLKKSTASVKNRRSASMHPSFLLTKKKHKVSDVNDASPSSSWSQKSFHMLSPDHQKQLKRANHRFNKSRNLFRKLEHLMIGASDNGKPLYNTISLGFLSSIVMMPSAGFSFGLNPRWNNFDRGSFMQDMLALWNKLKSKKKYAGKQLQEKPSNKLSIGDGKSAALNLEFGSNSRCSVNMSRNIGREKNTSTAEKSTSGGRSPSNASAHPFIASTPAGGYGFSFGRSVLHRLEKEHQIRPDQFSSLVHGPQKHTKAIDYRAFYAMDTGSMGETAKSKKYRYARGIITNSIDRSKPAFFDPSFTVWARHKGSWRDSYASIGLSHWPSVDACYSLSSSKSRTFNRAFREGFLKLSRSEALSKARELNEIQLLKSLELVALKRGINPINVIGSPEEKIQCPEFEDLSFAGYLPKEKELARKLQQIRSQKGLTQEVLESLKELEFKPAVQDTLNHTLLSAENHGKNKKKSKSRYHRSIDTRIDTNKSSINSSSIISRAKTTSTHKVSLPSGFTVSPDLAIRRLTNALIAHIKLREAQLSKSKKIVQCLTKDSCIKSQKVNPKVRSKKKSPQDPLKTLSMPVNGSKYSHQAARRLATRFAEFVIRRAGNGAKDLIAGRFFDDRHIPRSSCLATTNDVTYEIDSAGKVVLKAVEKNANKAKLMSAEMTDSQGKLVTIWGSSTQLKALSKRNRTSNMRLKSIHEKMSLRAERLNFKRKQLIEEALTLENAKRAGNWMVITMVSMAIWKANKIAHRRYELMRFIFIVAKLKGFFRRKKAEASARLIRARNPAIFLTLVSLARKFTLKIRSNLQNKSADRILLFLRKSIDRNAFRRAVSEFALRRVAPTLRLARIKLKAMRDNDEQRKEHWNYISKLVVTSPQRMGFPMKVSDNLKRVSIRHTLHFMNQVGMHLYEVLKQRRRVMLGHLTYHLGASSPFRRKANVLEFLMGKSQMTDKLKKHLSFAEKSEMQTATEAIKEQRIYDKGKRFHTRSQHFSIIQQLQKDKEKKLIRDQLPKSEKKIDKDIAFNAAESATNISDLSSSSKSLSIDDEEYRKSIRFGESSKDPLPSTIRPLAPARHSRRRLGDFYRLQPFEVDHCVDEVNSSVENHEPSLKHVSGTFSLTGLRSKLADSPSSLVNFEKARTSDSDSGTSTSKMTSNILSAHSASQNSGAIKKFSQRQPDDPNYPNMYLLSSIEINPNDSANWLNSSPNFKHNRILTSAAQLNKDDKPTIAKESGFFQATLKMTGLLKSLKKSPPIPPPIQVDLTPKNSPAATPAKPTVISQTPVRTSASHTPASTKRSLGIVAGLANIGPEDILASSQLMFSKPLQERSDITAVHALTALRAFASSANNSSASDASIYNLPDKCVTLPSGFIQVDLPIMNLEELRENHQSALMMSIGQKAVRLLGSANKKSGIPVLENSIHTPQPILPLKPLFDNKHAQQQASSHSTPSSTPKVPNTPSSRPAGLSVRQRVIRAVHAVRSVNRLNLSSSGAEHPREKGVLTAGDAMNIMRGHHRGSHFAMITTAIANQSHNNLFKVSENTNLKEIDPLSSVNLEIIEEMCRLLRTSSFEMNLEELKFFIGYAFSRFVEFVNCGKFHQLRSTLDDAEFLRILDEQAKSVTISLLGNYSSNIRPVRGDGDGLYGIILRGMRSPHEHMLENKTVNILKSTSSEDYN